MSTLEQSDGIHRLDLDAGDPYVVPLAGGEPSPGCSGDCRRSYLCQSCTDAVRAEALSWLHGLSRDHFGFDPMDLFPSVQQNFELQVLWRDPRGVAQMSPEPQLPPRH